MCLQHRNTPTVCDLEVWLGEGTGAETLVDVLLDIFGGKKSSVPDIAERILFFHSHVL